MKLKKIILYTLIGIVVFLFLFYNLYTPKIYKFKGKSDKTIFIVGSVHGNEPSGTKACYRLINYYRNNKPENNLIIMPQPNPLGLYVGSRYQLKPFNRDLNRNFNNVGKDRISKIILKYVNKADLIIDTHEGYEFNVRYPKSMGSSIIPNKSKLSKTISKYILYSVNKTIKDKDKKFVVSDFYSREDCYLPDSLGCYSNKNNKNYISLETTGLMMNKQPLNIRVNQHYILLREITEFKINIYI